MAKDYKVGEKYYLPVTVERIVEGEFGVTLSYTDGDEGDTALIWNAPDLLLTATEIAENIAGRRCAECFPMYDEVKSSNEELKSRNEELKSRNAELEAENEKQKAENDEWQKTARCYSFNAIRDLELTRKLRAEIKGLKAERDDLKSQVGKYTADIQDMAAEIHFHKEFGEGLDKQHKELQARYDELDSVNHEQAEKIRKLDKALTDLKQRNDKLQAENTNLTFRLEDQPEEEPTKTVHAVLNDGTGYNFFKCTKASFDNYADFSVLKIYRGEEYVAGFLRGDKPMNLAYWWTE